ncbi:glycosyltransferase family 2 protein [Asticcacaulis solisilvae]|uniref:glycosyltransferase family 2 protein n=1 Tax=Asticcacaulis solisilvae TaxID=1217274 RepID=UPI003FD8A699
MTELVTVVIPSYNAEATLDETLVSVRAQTWSNLEILVVDDGSRDATFAIAERHAAEDSRVRAIRKENGGVAEARNLAIAQAKGDYIAPVDADDLWHPTKIEKQMAAMAAMGEKCGLVYTWFRAIDADSRIMSQRGQSSYEGDVLEPMCFGNLVGNGSSPLMRKAVVLEAGGYDPSLRANNAQGCEDLKIYFEIARHHHFAVVREELTGYRWTADNMSSDSMKMLRSFDLVMNPMRDIYGAEYGKAFEEGRLFFMDFLLIRAILYGPWKGVWGPWMALYRDRGGRPPLKTTLRGLWGRFRLWTSRRKPVTAPKYLDAVFPL